ncbi:CinA family protein [Methylobacillus flagellatus]|uniref:CinA family protein n=1 Tax=Methylobacillus flagellatus TaxID=405 RepID=UPI0010F8D9A5|nr:nicotinamide-nucleotide amidohydrolase family protein [Methylobacillus flagellatus]
MADVELLDLSTALGLALQRRGWQLALAESCTGGLVAAAITDIAGSSAWFDRGFVTYSNLAKQQMLGVNTGTLVHHGAVSAETALEMASGALVNSTAHISAAITGIAGPGGGSEHKPVGMVCFAWASRDGHLESQTMQFAGDRAAVRLQSAKTALAGLLRLSLALDL